MQKIRLGNTDLEIVPMVFGGNVFGWTLDEKDSFRILDAFTGAGFNAIDTADVYSAWAPGNSGGESEAIIGRWLAARPGMREKIRLFTKVGARLSEQEKGLSEHWITEAVERSLTRLQTDYIDLYLSHWPDPDTAAEETLRAHEKLLSSGKVRHIGASNLSAGQLQEFMSASADLKLPAYQVLQPEYNLYDRAGFEGDLQTLCLNENIGVITYFSLASGFLTGKYQTAEEAGSVPRAAFLKKYFDARGERILKALRMVSARHHATQAETALAWLLSRRGVSAPVVSATSTHHIDSFRAALSLNLSADDLRLLTEAGDVQQ